MHVLKKFASLVTTTSRFFAFFSILFLLVFYGFGSGEEWDDGFILVCQIFSIIGILSIVIRWVANFQWKPWVLLYDSLFVAYFSITASKYFEGDLAFYAVFLFLFFVREAATFKINYKRTGLNPAQLFILSFAFVIFLGALLLMMPNSTTSGISFTDALFTSTSAVCVTGLSVVDTQFAFTTSGKTLIMALIQIGGLGIMTFASYFSFFFKGSSSFNNRLYFGELSNENELSNVFSSLKNVLLLTLFIESFGAIFIFFSVPSELHSNFFEHIFFSIFHSISSFNNAGFSLYSSNLFDPRLSFNYPFQLIISFLVIFGGLGFPIMKNVLELMFYNVNRNFKRLFRMKKIVHKAWIINNTTKIILITSAILLVSGTILFYIFEFNGVLVNHGPIGKWVISFVGSVTPRTAGFNSFDMSALALPTILIMMFLMWIGASPASTGGGIKTSTFAIACLNFVSLAKGQERIEISKREISSGTVRRAFSIIFLSLLTISIASFLLILVEPDKRPLHLIFESFSAYSTVGLSINLTPTLNQYAKYILILLMFIGRVSTLSILIAIFTQVKQKNYSYPSDEVLIN
ncbi:MAG: hypothetical protein RL037_1932 [Bacteroidota bacterium]